MREIKFRAWDTFNRGMWEVTELNTDNGGVMQIGMVQSDGLYFCVDEENKPESYKTSNFVLMQYTGLKDKNGKEIYEGDVVVLDEHTRGVIRFEGGAFILNYIKGGVDTLFDWDTTKVIEVIGNIYENQELLKEVE